MTVHWPPQPCVEDEVTSLEHEQIPPGLVEELKSDDDPAISRGAVNQTPIIQDSSQTGSVAQQGIPIEVKATDRNADHNSSDDGTGPVTPPPTGHSEARTQTLSGQPSHHPARSQPPKTRSEDMEEQHHHHRGRPEVSRIDTSLGADLQAMATGNRRAPSPYSYSRVAETQNPLVSSPTTIRASPVQDDAARNLRFSPNSTAEIRAAFSDEPDTVGRERRRHRSKSRARSRSQPREPSSRRDGRSSRRRLSDSSSDENQRLSRRGRKESDYISSAPTPQKHLSDREKLTPPHSRRQSKDSYYSATAEEFPRQNASQRRSGRYSGESPYASSNEEAGKYRHTRSEKPETPSRPSANRRERPHFDHFPDEIRSRRSPNTTADDTSIVMVDRRRRSHLEPTTPVTADAARSMEDYFEQAFQDNRSRRTNTDRKYRTSGSVVASPISSPPRTPRSERQGRDYLENDGIRRPSVRSRPPSIDEGQAAKLKSQATLLSTAAVGAAMAARNSTEQSSANRTPDRPRPSRTSSVQGDRDTQHFRRASSNIQNTAPGSVPQQRMERSPESLFGTSDAQARNRALPQRAATYSALNQPKSILKNPSVSINTAEQILPTSRQSYQSPNVPRSATSATASRQSTSQSGDILKLPTCPRPRPVSGYKDWYSIKEMSNLDICPTCMDAMRSTRFGHLFVPSLPRPYNEPSVCVMSKPWARIAFLRAHRQGRSDLSYLWAVSKLPQDTRPCAGSKPDVRHWFTIVDPLTREDVPNFAVCSACVRTLEIIFPELLKLMSRPGSGTIEEKVCSLQTGSKHFPTFIDQFEQAAARCGGRLWRSSDIQPLVNSIRRASRFQECCRDKLLPTRAWHFMPDLPEFTICEECYDEVVWPLSDKAVARDISKALKLVPAQRNANRFVGISCQLYSDRMRKVFRNAVATRSLGPLRDAVRTRQATQLRLHEMNKLYEADQKYGIDRRREIGKNDEIWRSLE